ncbi:MAG: signal peptide peptidase SppA [Candidatus Nealsonbacteria bacterium]|nr:signal peptide peptidase SppA [Candidatus Nealsonbacteria bacterium]
MKEKIKLVFKTIFLIAIVSTIAMYWYDQYNYYFGEYYEYTLDCPLGSNVALIKIQGEIVTYGTELVDSESSETVSEDITSSETVVEYINQIEGDDYMEAIIVEIDSYGGSPVASEEIMNALKRTTKPTVAVIREGGVSGAYLIASGADIIFASEMSDIGGIGITMSYLDYSQQNKQEGIIYQQLSLGKFKDTGDPDKNLTTEEKELLMRDIKILHEAFVRRVAENRGLDIEKVEKLADGSTMLGIAAKENGLIDEIGDINDAKNWLREQFTIEPEICVY